MMLPVVAESSATDALAPSSYAFTLRPNTSSNAASIA